MNSHIASLRNGSIADRLWRMADAGWSLRARSGVATDLPFALALFTDDRRQGPLIPLLEALPPARAHSSIAVIFRHDHLEAAARLSLAREAMALTQSKGHLFFSARLQLSGADGVHAVPRLHMDGYNSAPVHSWAEGHAAHLRKTDLGFVSPVFATKSHPNAAPLGPVRASAIAAKLPYPCFALGGIDPHNWKRLVGMPFTGIGAVGAMSP